MRSIAMTMAGLLACPMALLVGCTSTAEPLPDVDEVLERARNAAESVTSYQATGSTVYVLVDGRQRQLDVDVAWASPDRYRLGRVFSNPGEPPIVQEVIYIGTRGFSRYHEDGERWEEDSVPSSLPAVAGKFPTPELEDPVPVGRETLGGVEVYHVTGRVTQRRTLVPTEGMEEAELPSVKYDLYIGVEDWLLRRMAFATVWPHLPGSASQDDDFVPVSAHGTLEFFAFDEPVTIEPPSGFK